MDNWPGREPKMCRSKLFLTLAVLAGLFFLILEPASGQDYPTSCKPVGTKSCAAYRPGEFRFESKACTFTPYFPTEYEAAEYAKPTFGGSDAGCPEESWEFSRWAQNEFSNCSGSQCTPPNATFTICFPGTGAGPYPQYEAGYDVVNYSIFTQTRFRGQACDLGTTDYGLVRISRGVYCPAGFFSGVSGSHCERNDNRPEVGKNLGCPVKDIGQCSAGNPINIQMGNKYQVETDYVGTGPNPLVFKRFYNSLAGRDARSNGLYRFAASDGTAPIRAALDPSQESGVRAMATDSIGASWRHTYHRALVEYATPTLRTVSMYRQDGRMFLFSENAGSWHADGDINFVLSEQTSGDLTTGWTVVTPTDETETYNAGGQLVAIEDRNGTTVTLSYDSGGRLASATDHFGKTLSFGYESDYQSGTEWFEDPTLVNQIKTMTDPLGQVYEYEYFDDGTLTKVTYPDLTFRQYGYNDVSGRWPFVLTSIIDENGDQYATFEYTGGGLARASHRGQGADVVGRIDVTYDFPGAPPYYYVTGISVVEAQGMPEERSYTVDPSFVLGVSKMSSLSRTGANESRTYDANGNVETHNDRNGVQLYREYNSRNLETLRREANGTPVQREITTTWHPTYRLKDIVTEPMRTIDHDYYANGDLQRITVTSLNVSGTEDLSTDGNRTRSWSYTYNGFGQVTSIDGPRVDVADVITLDYYDEPACPAGDGKCGQLEFFVNAAGHRTDFNEYFADGRLKTMTDPNGLVAEYEYDSRRRLTKITESGGASQRITNFNYDAAGQVDSVTFPDGLVLDYEWTTAHLLDHVIDNLGNRIDYEYNAHGERTAEHLVDSNSVIRRAVEKTFDQLGFVDAVTVGLLSSNDSITTDYDFDSMGNLVKVTDADLNATEYLVDELNRAHKITDALTNDSDYAFNGQDQVTSVAAPNGAVTSLPYDGLGNLDREASPDRGLIDFDYDDAGNLRSKLDARGVNVSYEYDVLNRLTAILYPDSSLNATFQYDQGPVGIGRLYEMVDASGSTTYGYDIFGNLSTVSVSQDGLSYVTSYDYDAQDRIAGITYPSGKHVEYLYDSAGRINEVRLDDNGTVTTLASNVSYRPFGPVASLDFGNGLALAREHDLDYKLKTQTTTGIQSLSFGHDAVGNVSDKFDLLDSQQSQNFDYDELNRLDYAEGDYGILDYVYDPVGNRTGESHNGDSTIYSYEPNSNRLSDMTGSDVRSITHDASGNIITMNNRTFVYGDHNRLAEVRDGSGTVASYTYNGTGQRVKKATAASTLYFMYGQSGELLAEIDGSGAVLREFVYLNGEPLALLDNTGTSGSEIILDNDDPGVSFTGAWGASTSVAGFEGANYLYHAPGDGSGGALVADNSDATFSGVWPTSTSVAGYEGANYQFHAANGALVVVDNAAATFVGSWPSSTSVTGYHGSNYQHHTAGTGTNSASWSTIIGSAGDYTVFGRWSSHPNRATDATYTVSHSSGTDVVSVNQQLNGGEWVPLGTYSLQSGTLDVTLTDQANGYVIADAIRIAPAGAGPNVATWAISVPSAEDYDVYARWTAHPNRATNATYRIDHASGTDSVAVNQQQMGGQWQLLGSFYFDVGTATIGLSDETDGYVIADAVMLAPAGVPPNQVVWDPELTESSDYMVYARWTAHPNRATDATYTIRHAGGTTDVVADQQADGDVWNLLATLTLNSDSTISITDRADGYVIADAIRLVPVGAGGAQGAVYYYHNDHLSTPQILTDDSGAVAWRAAYEPFGEAQISVENVENNLRFPGQYFDQEVGLHYNYFRTYDPTTGRYLESDPIGLNGGLNTYGYVSGNPLSFTDPFGLLSFEEIYNCLFGGEGVSTPGCFEDLMRKSAEEHQDAAEEVLEDTVTMLRDGSVQCGACIAKCTFTTLVGETPEEFLLTFGGKVAERYTLSMVELAAGKAARTAVDAAIKRITVPIDTLRIVHCTLECTE